MAKPEFCTCMHLDCKNNPANHDEGCTPCIRQCVKNKIMPSCFFHSLEHLENRKGDSFAAFAEVVLENERLKNAAEQ